MHLDLSLLRDTLGSGPGLTTFPLRSVWKRIVFTKDALTKLSVKILPVLQKLPTPLSVTHVTALVNKDVQPFHSLFTSITTRVVILDNILVNKSSPLDYLYSDVSGTF